MTDLADFRSDTVTRPDAAMRAAMASAEVGDDVMGEDPTVRALEIAAAGFLGKEAAVFVPSGTMANQIAIHVHCRSGDELICESRSHVYLYEAGGFARWSGVMARTLPSVDGFPDPEAIASVIRVDDPHLPRSRLLVLENTHNMAGGRYLSAVGMAKRCAVAKEHSMRVHVDGARLANAAVAAGCEAAELVSAADSVSLCFSKGLGAPVGSVVAGNAEFVRDARRTRKALGGGMRQSGILAAAALLALQEGPGRLALDHARARRIAESLADVSSFEIEFPEESTNIVMIDIPNHDPSDLLEYLAPHGILASAFSAHRLRLVVHRDLHDRHIDRFIEHALAWAEQASGKETKL